MRDSKARSICISPKPKRARGSPKREVTRPDGSNVFINMDGTNRASCGSNNYAPGREACVKTAEHCLARGDVDYLAVRLLSSKNVQKRSLSFLAELGAQVAALNEAVRKGLCLRRVRIEHYGTLRPLERRGVEGRYLARQLKALTKQTACIIDPKMTLELLVGDPPSTLYDLGINVAIRTGMEERSVFRLSGLDAFPGILYAGTTTLWPNFGPPELDDILDRAVQTKASSFSGGYRLDEGYQLIQTLARAGLDHTVSITLPIDAPRSARLELAARTRVSFTGAPVEVRIVSPAAFLTKEVIRRYDAVLLPGQLGPLYQLPYMALDDANVHGCGETPAEIAAGVLRALRFCKEHPPHHGAERVYEVEAGPAEPWPPRYDDWIPMVAAHIDEPAEVLAGRLPVAKAGREFRNLVGDVFAIKVLLRATAWEVLTEGASFARKRAALNYVWTAFLTCFRAPTDADDTGTQWEKPATLFAMAMLIIAASDEDIMDMALGEAKEERLTRVTTSVEYLCASIRTGALRPPPDVTGSERLIAITQAWKRLIDPYIGVSHPCVIEGLRAAIIGLFQANIAELNREVTHNPLIEQWSSMSMRGEATDLIERSYIARAPKHTAARIREVVNARYDAEGSLDEAARELTLYCYLIDVKDSIAAGLVFWALGLETPSLPITHDMLSTLRAAEANLNMFYRLSNDLADLRAGLIGDRDDKDSAWMVLGPERAHAAATCERVIIALRAALAAALGDMERAWPRLAALMNRATYIGRRVYELGHYETLELPDMQAIGDELVSSVSH